MEIYKYGRAMMKVANTVSVCELSSSLLSLININATEIRKERDRDCTYTYPYTKYIIIAIHSVHPDKRDGHIGLTISRANTKITKISPKSPRRFPDYVTFS